MLDSNRLHVLREVARCSSFAAAAAALDYTPSAVSQQVAALERAVGATLVERGRRGISLTEPGRTLVTHAERILTAMEAAESEIDALVRVRSGLLRLGWFATAGASLMPKAIATFRTRHPDVHLHLVEADPEECAERLKQHQLELALIYDFELGGRRLCDNVCGVDLLEDRLYVALPRHHVLASRTSISLRDLADEPWIQGVRGGSTLEVLPIACRAAGFEPNVAFRTDDHMAVQGLVAAGVGVGLIPSIALPTARPDIEVRPITDPALVRTVRAALPPTGYRAPAADAMLEILAEVSPKIVSYAMQYLDTQQSQACAQPDIRNSSNGVTAFYGVLTRPRQ